MPAPIAAAVGLVPNSTQQMLSACSRTNRVLVLNVVDCVLAPVLTTPCEASGGCIGICPTRPAGPICISANSVTFRKAIRRPHVVIDAHLPYIMPGMSEPTTEGEIEAVVAADCTLSKKALSAATSAVR